MNHAQYITQSNLKEMAYEHISYEIEMLNFSLDKLIKGGLNILERNAFLEDLLLHSRNIIDFLYLDEPNHSDDTLALDFFIDAEPYLRQRPPISESLINLKKRANKEINHLTYARLEVTSEGKIWQTASLWKEINNVLAIFFNCLSDEQRGWFRITAISQ